VQKATADARSSLDANAMQRSEAARTFAAQEAIRYAVFLNFLCQHDHILNVFGSFVQA
jgi:hypothetical protein